MARIRTVKPSYFRHEGLQDLEAANPGAYPMLVFSGLWAIADREGRFEWKPRVLKLDVLPFLSFDMQATLKLLADNGYLLRYEVAGNVYGFITSWERHQLAGRDEPPSEIPAPDGSMTEYQRPPNTTERTRMYERDKYACAYCQKNLRDHPRLICLDHVIPYTQGGTNSSKNLVTACKVCNAKKGGRTPTEAEMPWPEGFGESYPVPVNTPLTEGQQVSDKEGEWDRDIGNGKDIKAIVEPDGSTAIVPITQKTSAIQPKTPDVVANRVASLLAEVQQSANKRLTADELRKAQSGLVFAYWAKKLIHPKAVLDETRERLLVRRLKENRGDVNELLYCVDGALKDPWTMGTDPKSTKKYDGIETIFRERSQVEKFAGLVQAYKDNVPHPMAVKYMALSDEPPAQAAS